jgi:tetratricopeptide (TPR) repeat protein
MNSQKITQILSNIDILNQISVEELNQLVRDFPYMTLPHLLLAKKLHDNNDLHAGQQIKKTAILIPNRKRLYELLYRETVRTTIASTVEKPQPETAKAEKEETATNEDVAFQNPLQFHSLKGETTIIPGEKEEIADEANPQKEEQLDELENEVLKHAMESAYAFTSDDIPEKNKTSEDLEKPEETSGSDREEKKLSPNERQAFSKWLQILDKERLEKVREKEKQEQKQQQSKLIDKFIKEEPQISKVDKDEDFSPEGISRMNVVDNDDFVTETLAKIYTQQGNIEKAKNIYNKLMLKYPEKKAYFAGQLKKIDNQDK